MARNLLTAGILSILAFLPLHSVDSHHRNGRLEDALTDQRNDATWSGIDSIGLSALQRNTARQAERGEGSRAVGTSASVPALGQSGLRSQSRDPVAQRTGAYEAVAPMTPRSAAHGPKPYKFLGTASYYGGEFRGRKTATGERFNPTAMTAAHKTLPLGSRVRVTNLRNGRSVEVTINDRGPYTRGRIIDLSKGAARKLDMLHSGTARVRLEVLTKKDHA
jgi:rare lipoprotein A (peptidoglycan hydrolase)